MLTPKTNCAGNHWTRTIAAPIGRLSYDAMGGALTESSPRRVDNRHVSSASATGPTLQEVHMGKYVFAWLLGVPAFVLVIVYMLAH